MNRILALMDDKEKEHRREMTALAKRLDAQEKQMKASRNAHAELEKRLEATSENMQNQFRDHFLTSIEGDAHAISGTIFENKFAELAEDLMSSFGSEAAKYGKEMIEKNDAFRRKLARDFHPATTTSSSSDPSGHPSSTSRNSRSANAPPPPLHGSPTRHPVASLASPPIVDTSVTLPNPPQQEAVSGDYYSHAADRQYVKSRIEKNTYHFNISLDALDGRLKKLEAVVGGGKEKEKEKEKETERALVVRDSSVERFASPREMESLKESLTSLGGLVDDLTARFSAQSKNIESLRTTMVSSSFRSAALI